MSISTVVLDLPQKCSSLSLKRFSSQRARPSFSSIPPRPSSLSLSFCLSFYLLLLFCDVARSLSFLTLSSPSSAAVLLATTFFSVFTVQFLVPILPSFIVALFKLLMPRRQSSLLLSVNE